jgi:hypothetical protein
VGLDESTDAIDHHGFGWKGLAIASQHVQKGLAGHGARLAERVVEWRYLLLSADRENGRGRDRERGR